MVDASDTSTNLSDPSRIVSFDSSTMIYSILSTDNTLGDKTISVTLTATSSTGNTGTHSFDIVTVRDCASVLSLSG